jgi:hypothetical protein
VRQHSRPTWPGLPAGRDRIAAVKPGLASVSGYLLVRATEELESRHLAMAQGIRNFSKA